ncbi:MAG: RHH-type proline utilization regulon transcriptional repressor/proline dehydrogenase [Candidatus Omnitrophota bacterium]|jgi:RHH-type proline utilization regulon transcriptional repressor/proline dehydrogenase/delta 1-pyrroline-5-carboxylate dehydrogenase
MNIEQNTQDLGRKLLATARAEEAKLAKAHLWENTLIDWCMGNEELKIRAFQFIDVFPHLKTDRQVLKHIREYFPNHENAIPTAIRAGLLLTYPKALTQKAIHSITRHFFEKIATLFVAAKDTNDAMQVVNQMWQNNATTSIDLLGESVISFAEANEFWLRYEDLIKLLGNTCSIDEQKNVSVKLSALDPCFNALESKAVIQRLTPRLEDLLLLAAENRVTIHFDMEEYAVRDLTLDVLKELSLTKVARDFGFGLVLQAYLKDSEHKLQKIQAWATSFKKPLIIRLVRGAYWDQEVMLARDNGWAIPVYTKKHQTDINFETLALQILKSSPHIKLACATHNIRSIAFVASAAESIGLDKSAYEYQFLYGMGAPLMKAVIKEGHRPRMYMPIGDPVLGMAYLVRRLLENMSSQSFVRNGLHSESTPEVLLKNPNEESDIDIEEELKDPCPLLEFHIEHIRDKFETKLKTITEDFAVEIPAIIGDKEVWTHEKLYGLSPNDNELLVSKCAKPTREDATMAVDVATQTFEFWSHVKVEERAAYLRKAAQWLIERRYELAAIIVHEVGKSWSEADADVKEAVDFMFFYAQRACLDFRAKETQILPNESNYTHLISRGPAAIIAPWNFPAALIAGMTSAALVTGNTAIMKPAEQSPLSAWFIFQAFRAAGLPDGVLSFLPGEGEVVGEVLVKDPRIAIIAFTGSMEVGLDIANKANQRHKKQKHIKKLIIEMGGKNAAIVDSTADLDQAIPAIISSAFAFAGQKCSALSRIYVLEDIYDKFIERLDEAAECIRCGTPLEAQNMCGPVIDSVAMQRIEQAVSDAEEIGHIIVRRIPLDAKGNHAPLIIIGGLPLDSPLHKEELFGPLLIVERVFSFDSAIDRANDSKFALTGGIYSRTPSHIDKALHQLEVGNLYINRGITGALVGRQPFGGYHLSGTGTKAGGYNYLREFCIERTVSENMYRHGFAPYTEA